MKRNVISGSAAVLFGLLIALGPQFIFKVCGVELHHDDEIIRCNWVARMEIATGALIAALGVCIIFISDFKIQLGLTIGIFMADIVSASFLINQFVGLCREPEMACQKVTLPALVVICSLLFAGAVFNMIYLERKTRV